jgi:hypothetical protein
MFKLFASAVASVGMLFGGLFGHPGTPPGMPNSSSTPPSGFSSFLQNLFGGNSTSTAVVTLPYGPGPGENHGWNASSTPPDQAKNGHTASSTNSHPRLPVFRNLPRGWISSSTFPGGIIGPSSGTSTPPPGTYSSGGTNHNAGVAVVEGTASGTAGNTLIVIGTSPATERANRPTSAATIPAAATYSVDLSTAKVIDSSGNPTTIQPGDVVAVEGTITGTNATATIILDEGPAS